MGVESNPSWNDKVANASLFGAICVVSIHVSFAGEVGSAAWWCYQMIVNGFSRWAVPFFFAAAGFFLAKHVNEEGWWKRAVAKRMRSILLPLVVWSLIATVVYSCLIVLANQMAGRPLTTNFRTGSRMLAYIGMHPRDNIYLVCWFMQTLFCFVLVSPLFVWIGKRIGWGLPLVCYGMSFCGLPAMPYNCNPGWAVFFTAGLSVALCPPRIYGKISRSLWLLVVPALAWIAWDKHLLLEAGMLDRMDHTPFPAIVMLVVAVWSMIPNFKLPRFLQGHSFPVYLLHLMVLLIPAKCFHIRNIVLWFCLWGFAVVCSICISIFLKTKAPRLSDILFGGR